MLYSAIRPLLFKLPPETAHTLTLKSLEFIYNLGLIKSPHLNSSPINLMGIAFPNHVGLAAGLDKNGEYIAPLAALGFGFIEIGTVTPRPQSGNPKPRLFRLTQAEAIINRMGFNNLGVDHLVECVKKSQHDGYTGILGINIGKNFDTPLEQAAQDYALCLSRVYPYASYVAVNISSPNTPGLRQLQYGESLNQLLSTLKKQQRQLTEQHQKYVPLVVKIAPDLTDQEIRDIAQIFLEQQIDGVIATNTTLSRGGLPPELPHANEAGGLSGKPLFSKSLAVIQQLSQELQGRIPIIGCGGIMRAQDAKMMLNAGASLVQVYTGLIYRGPKLILDIKSIQ